MTIPSEETGHEGVFSTFTVGVAFGVVAALLFGTEEGRKLVKKGIDAIPDKYKVPPVNLNSVIHPSVIASLVLEPKQSHSTPIIPVEETSHHTTFDEPEPSDFTHNTPFGNSFGEAPPPPAPHVRPTRPEPFKPHL